MTDLDASKPHEQKTPARVDMKTYLTSLVRQIGFEKRAFETTLGFSLTLALGATGLSLKFILEDKSELALIVSGLAFTLVVALFMRAVRSYNNYYLYMLLKNTIVEEHMVTWEEVKPEVTALMKNVDLRRSWEGNNVYGLSKAKLTLRVLFHTEYIYLLVGLFALELVSWISSGWLLSIASGYVVLVQAIVLFFVFLGIYPRA